MKYLAIFRDSLREALDSKVLYVLVGLSGLVILLAASISFKPQSAQIGLLTIVQKFPGGQATFQSLQPVLDYDLIDFKSMTDVPGRPWEGEYRFTLIVKEEESKAFQRMVWLGTLQAENGESDVEDRDTRKRIIAIRDQAQDVPKEQLAKFLTQSLEQEISKVSPSQMERYIGNQLAAYGTFEATNVRLQPPPWRWFWESNPKPVGKKEFRFEVEAKAKAATLRTWPHTLTLFYGAYPTEIPTTIGSLVFGIENTLVGTTGAAIAMLISTIVTAFYIPNMLRKGTVDLLLAKPIRRATLLIYKYIGGLTFMFINTVVVVIGIWLVLGWRSGLWAPGFLLTILVLTFEFAIFYSVSTLFGVLTRSPIVAILVTCLTWLVLYSVGTAYVAVEALRPMEILPAWVYPTVDSIHYVLPRYKDLDVLNGMAISRGLLGPDSPEIKVMENSFAKFKWGETLGFSAVFIALMLGLSCWRFATTDY